MINLCAYKLRFPQTLLLHAFEKAFTTSDMGIINDCILLIRHVMRVYHVNPGYLSIRNGNKTYLKKKNVYTGAYKFIKILI